MSDAFPGRCECGQALGLAQVEAAEAHRELACPCGRRHDVELLPSGWTPVACLNPERSLPISGFSRELRAAPDSERFWFTYPLRDMPLPVHVLFSPSARRAEVKAADLKVFAIGDVGSVSEARRRWVGWWKTVRGSGGFLGFPAAVPGRRGRVPVVFARRPRPHAAPAH